MYTLYFNKKDKILKIEVSSHLMAKKSAFTDVPTYYNDCFMLCNNRKALRVKAKEMHFEWIMELENELIQLKEMRIINKY